MKKVTYHSSSSSIFSEERTNENSKITESPFKIYTKMNNSLPSRPSTASKRPSRFKHNNTSQQSSSKPDASLRSIPLRAMTCLAPCSLKHMRDSKYTPKYHSNDKHCDISCVSLGSSEESLEELERLIEAQHIQLVAKGLSLFVHALIFISRPFTGRRRTGARPQV